MGDSEAAAPDKTKEKKKKKTGSTKEKESRKKSGAESDLQADVKPPGESEPPKFDPAANETQPSQEPPPTNGEAPPETVKKSKKKSVSKESAGEGATTDEATAAGAPEKPPTEEGASASSAVASRKTSAADGAATEGAEQGEEEATKLQPGQLPPPIGSSYVPPPAATKRDIDLLQDMDENKLMELKEAFELFDYDQDGYIDYKDLKLTYQSLGYPDVPDDDITNMLAEAVSPLDFDAFVILLGYKTIEMDPETVLVEALACWDYDNSGLISEDRIKHDLMTWGDKFSSEEAEQALEDAPIYVNKKGVSMIDYMKFSNTLCGLRKKTRMDQPVPN